MGKKGGKDGDWAGRLKGEVVEIKSGQVPGSK